MKKTKKAQLWIHFSIIIFVIMAFTAIIMIGLTILLFQAGMFHIRGTNPLSPIFFLLIISVIIGTVISIFVSKIILRPITNFTNAVEKVSQGDFSIRLKETSSILELKSLIHNFNSMAHELEGIETLRSDFIANVSHEFKTPIASIEGYATLLQDSSLTELERQEYCGMIIDSTKQLGSLTGNILLLSKLENQNVTAKPKKFRLDEQIRQAILLLEAKWTVKNIDLEIHLDKLNYLGNESLLMQVWINLIDNAIKFTPDSGTIQIVLKESGSNILFQIEDSGCGISPEVMKHIFDKFYQGDSSRKMEGNGLGLALAKKILSFCGGTISVESEEGYGATFKVMLQMIQAGNQE